MSDEQKMHPIPEGSYMETIDEFKESCGWGSFSNDDGTGYYANPPLMDYAKPARPSDFVKDKIEPGFTHVVWFNK